MGYKRTTFCLETGAYTHLPDFSLENPQGENSHPQEGRGLCTNHTPSIHPPGSFPMLLAILLIRGKGHTQVLGEDCSLGEMQPSFLPSFLEKMRWVNLAGRNFIQKPQGASQLVTKQKPETQV